jgi:hypothetical protein
MKFDDIPILESTQKRDPVSWGDWARAGGVGALRMVDVAPSLAQYLSGSGNDPYTLSAAMKRATGELANSLYEGMGEEAQRLAGARWLPDPDAPDVWDGDVSLPQALALQTIMSIPSLAVSVGAALAGGPAAGSAAVGAMYTASAYEDAVEALKDAPPEEFAENDYYQELLRQGYSHEDARFETIEYAIGVKPLVAGLLSAGLARGIGVEGLLGRFRSMPRTRAAAAGFVGEGTAEMAQEGVTASAVEAARFAAIGKDPRFYEIAQRAVAGGAVGAPLGAGIGAIAGGRRASAPQQQQEQGSAQQNTGVDPDQQLALSDGQADLFGDTNTRRAPVAEPEATPEPRDPNQADLFGDADQDSTSTDAGDADVDLEVVRQRARAPRRAAPTVTAPGAPSPDQVAALTAANAQVEAARQQAQTSELSVDQVVELAMQQLARDKAVAPTAQAPLQPPVSAAGHYRPAPTIDTPPVAPPAPALPPEVMPAAVQDTAPVAAPVQEVVPVQAPAPVPTDGGRRVLADLQAEQRVRQAEAARAKEASRGVALAGRAGDAVKTRATAREKRIGAAQDIINNSSGPTEAEAGYSKGSRDPQLYAATKARLDELIGAVERADAAAKKGEPKVKIPTEGRKGTPANISFLARARKIRDRIAAGDLPPAGDMATLIGDEKLVRGGSADVAQAGRTGVSNMRGSGKVSGESDGAGEVASVQESAGVAEVRSPDIDIDNLSERPAPEASRPGRQFVFKSPTSGYSVATAQRDVSTTTKRAEFAGRKPKVEGKVSLAPRSKPDPVAEAQKVSRERTAEAQAVVRDEGARAQVVEAEVAAPPPTPFERFTAAFKRWFGDSKVVDADGNPLVVYHAASVDIGNAFDPAKVQKGFWFGVNAADTATYAGRIENGFPNMTPVYLAIKNPALQPRMSTATLDIDTLKAFGHDGAYDPVFKVWVAFEPTQIKSAIGNKGTYDPANPSIAASVRARDTRGLITTRAGTNSAANVRANPQSVAKGKPMTLGARLLPLIGANPGGIQGEIWRRMVGDLRKIVSDVPVYVTDDAGMLAATADMLASGQLEGIADGFYDPTNNIIMLNQAALADPVNRGNLILHEATHAALHNLIETNAAVRSDLNAILKEAQSAFDGLTELTGERAPRPYGLSNVHELISEALSNPDFQNTLMNLSASPELAARVGLNQQRPSLWNTLVELARKYVFGNADGPPTLFEAVLRATEKTMAIRMQQGAVAGRGAPVASMGGRARTEAGYIAGAVGGTIKRWGMRAATLGGLAQQLDQQALVPGASANLKRFAGLARTLTDTMLSTSNIRRKAAENGNEVVQDLARLAKNNPEGYRTFEATVRDLHENGTAVIDRQNWTEQDLLDANKHVSKKRRSDKQKIKRMVELQNKFMALPSEFRTHHFKIQKFLESKMAYTAKQEIAATLSAVPADKMSDAQRADLAERVYNGRMTEDDKKLINNDIIYKHLRSTRNLRKPNGTYMPAMRFGKYRVRALAGFGDLMGGKEIAPDTVEFRMATDKEAWAATEKFMEATNLDITGHLSRVFYDKNTGELLNSEDRQAHGRERVRSGHPGAGAAPPPLFVRQPRRCAALHRREPQRLREHRHRPPHGIQHQCQH